MSTRGIARPHRRIMPKQQSKHWKRSSSGLWLPRYGLRGPDRRRLSGVRRMPGYPCCCPEGDELACPACPACTNAPVDFQVVINGCSTLDATYITTRVYPLSSPLNNRYHCHYEYILPTPICDVTKIACRHAVNSSFDSFNTVVYLDQSGAARTRWYKIWGVEKPDCAAMIDENIPLLVNGSGCCPGSPTALITAL